MTDETPARPTTGPGEVPPLDHVDPVLNIFALANSMDLHRDHLEPPDRVLAWFADGLERRIHLTQGAGGTFRLALGAAKWGRTDSGPWTPFGDPVTAGDLKARLTEAVEAANALPTPEGDTP
jgi:hypothetical protein